MENIRKKVFIKIFKKIVFDVEKTRCTEPPISKIENRNLELINHKVTAVDGVEVGISIVKSKEISSGTTFIVILHGTGCNRGSFAWLFDEGGVLDRNICALLVDYRGFGDSQGQFTSEGVNHDIDACLEYLRSTYNPQKVHVYGHSLGSAIIFEYAKYAKTHRKKILFKKVVSASGFRSLEDVCKRFSLWNIATLIPGFRELVNARFGYTSIDNILYLDKENVLLLHGRYDELVPSTHALSLAKVSGATLHLTSDDHVSIVGNRDVWNEIFNFFEQ